MDMLRAMFGQGLQGIGLIVIGALVLAVLAGIVVGWGVWG